MTEEQNKTAETEEQEKEKSESEPAAEEEVSAEETETETNEAEQPDSVPESESETASDSTAELEELRTENLRLKAQLEAHGAGFRREYIEDAVLIAENAAKRDGTTIQEALQAVAKKYPDWKYTSDSKQKSGFKVGADTPKEETNENNESLDRAFGLRRNKKG